MNNNETGQAKRLDMSVLHDGFLIERLDTLWITRMEQDYRELDMPYRAAVNIWHFNDGSMVLPDGLVVEVNFGNGSAEKGYTKGGGVLAGTGYMGRPDLYQFHKKDEDDGYFEISAVKILGVTPEYATHGKELGMEAN